MDAMESFSDNAEDLMEEVYQYMTHKCYPLGCTEGRKGTLSNTTTKL